MDSTRKSSFASGASSSRVNKKILEYCVQFGQNRDLEKFLRIHSSSSRSSESSSYVCGCASEDDDGALCKAMHRLFFINNPECIDKLETCRSPSLNQDVNIPITIERALEDINEHLEKGTQAEVCEAPKTSLMKHPVKVQSKTPDPEEKSQTHVVNSFTQPPINTSRKHTRNTKTPDSQPKSHKPLEWDSLGDVGYKKSMSTSNLSTLERSVLKEFFHSGVTPKVSSQAEILNDENLKRSHRSSTEFDSTLCPKTSEKWRQTLEKVKKKYSTPPLASSTLLDSGSIFKKPQSIPLATSSITREKSSAKHEKCSQTSFVGAETASQEVQVNMTPVVLSAAGSLATQSSFEYNSSSYSSGQLLVKKPSFKLDNLDKEGQRKRMVLRENNVSLPNSSKTSGSSIKSTENSVAGLHSSLSSTAVRSQSKENKENKENCHSVTRLSLGIQLLCSLIDAKNLNRKQKKNLIRDIVAKICKISSSASSASHLSALSMQSLIERLPISEISSSDIANDANVLNGAKITAERVIKENEPETAKQTAASAGSTSPSSISNSSSSKLATVKKAKKTPKSTSESDQATMQEWLNPMTQSELDYERNKQSKNQPQSVSSSGSRQSNLKKKQPKTEDERCMQLIWIKTEIQRLESLKNLLLLKSELTPSQQKNSTETSAQAAEGSQCATSQQLYDTVCSDKSADKVDVVIEESSEDVVNTADNYKRSVRRIKESNVIYDKPNDEQKKPRFTKETTTTVIDEEQRIHLSSDNCAAKVQNSNPEAKKNRSKMETPPQSIESESVCSFVQQRKRQFLDHYQNKKNKINNETLVLAGQHVKQHHQIPLNDHYSEPRSTCNRPAVPVPDRNFRSRCTTTTSTVTTCSSMSSMFCISSEMSIPMMATNGCSSSSTTTTHQYDNRCAVGIQTGDSLRRTQPIFGPQSSADTDDRQQPEKHTQRVLAKNQIVQVKPKAMAYVISFDGGAPPACDSNSPAVSLTLQEHLQLSRPQFCVHAEQRKQILNKLHCLRKERDREVRAIIDNTSINSIPRKLNKLPPPPTKQVRIFPTREMKAITNKRYSRLPEVIEKAEREKNEKWRKSNRILTDLFNKKLQKRVHDGKLSLNHSGTVI